MSRMPTESLGSVESVTAVMTVDMYIPQDIQKTRISISTESVESIMAVKAADMYNAEDIQETHISTHLRIYDDCGNSRYLQRY